MRLVPNLKFYRQMGSGSKHKNKRVEYDGHKFASKRECERYKELRLMEKAGLIADLILQESFVLCKSVILDGRKKPALVYRADFSYCNVIQDPERGIVYDPVVEDAKAPHLRKNPVFRIKRHLMKAVHGIDIKLT